MKRRTLLFLLPFFALASCTTTASSSESPQQDSSGNPTSPSLPSGQEGKAIVVYYSATGNTERVVNTIADHLSCPIYELEPVEPYTDEDLDYGDSDSRVSQEHAIADFHTPLTTVSFEGFDEATYVFLGAPIWWGTLSWVIDEFVLENDFTGKTIIPFATASSSNFSLSSWTSLSDEATWHEGRRFLSRDTEEDIIAWVDGLSLPLSKED